jgi:serine/threonine protein kinase
MVKADFNELFAECNPLGMLIHAHYYWNNISYLAIDLLDKLLRFDPKERYTVEEALHHPYFSLLHVDEDEPVCSEIDTADWEFDLQIENNYSKEDIRYLVCKEIVRFNPSLRIQYSDKFQGSVIPGHYRSHSF